MISKKMIAAYDFETIEDYFDYILLSKVNGQHGQVVSLIKALSKEQKKEFLGFLETLVKTDDAVYCKEKTIEFL